MAILTGAAAVTGLRLLIALVMSPPEAGNATAAVGPPLVLGVERSE